MKKFAVFGDPIEHSLSPVIHQQFAEQFAIQLNYQKIRVKTDDFVQAVKDFGHTGGAGLNITVPHKTAAYQLADKLTETAKLAKAVNTLVFSESGLIGHNTDGIGLVKDLTANHGLDLSGQKILILGAGGAVRGVLEPLLAQQIDKIVIANRTAEKAVSLASEFDHLGFVEGCGLDEIGADDFELIINGTAASLTAQLPPIPSHALKRIQFGYDMMYAKQPTVFMNWLKQTCQAQVADGLGMLVEQAAAAFHCWHQQMPNTQPVLQALRQAA